jgi:hypothetical protein
VGFWFIAMLFLFLLFGCSVGWVRDALCLLRFLFV